MSQYTTESQFKSRVSDLDNKSESLGSRISKLEDTSTKLRKDIDDVNNNKNKLDSKINQMDGKVGANELNKLESLVNDEVEKIKKEQKDIQNNIQNFFNTSKKDVEAVKSTSKADLEALKKSVKSDVDSAVKNLPKPDMSQYTSESQFKTSISHLQDNIQDLQTKLSSVKEESSTECQKMGASYVSIKTQLEEQKSKIENIGKAGAATAAGAPTQESGAGKNSVENLKNTVLSLEKGLKKMDEEMRKKMHSQQENNMSLIDKQRRAWENSREKAEQMSQIFDSLIITNDRPYVSCGLDSPLLSAGMIVFNQFELINKIEYEEDIGFNVVEPGVYILQISGTLSNCSLSVKLVSDHLEAELLLLSSAPSPSTSFKSRSTIFTVEDDDRDCEKIVVDIVEKDTGESLRVDSDLSMLMYKISEVSNCGDAGTGEVWRLVEE